METKFQDEICTNTEIEFGIWEKIKILFGKKVFVDTKTMIEVDAKSGLTNILQSNANAHVERAFKSKSQGEILNHQ